MDTRIAYFIVALVTACVNLGLAYVGITTPVACTVGQVAAAIQGTAWAAEATSTP